MQPRKDFGAQALAALTDSVRERGVLQPLLVRKADSGYELIAGERRLRAASEAGLAEVPAIVLDASDQESVELALIENLQREDLNPIEEAEGYSVLAERFDLTQEQIAARVAKSRPAVANALRLLDLPDDVKQLVAAGRISAGHAKVLTGLEVPGEQSLFGLRAAEDGLSVRQLEQIIRASRRSPRKPRASRSDMPAEYLAHLSDALHRLFGTSVQIVPSKTYANGKKARGSIRIDFYSNEELSRVLEIVGLAEEDGTGEG